MLEHDDTDPVVERMALALRGSVDLGSDIDRAVMSAIRAAPLRVAPGAATAAPRRTSPWSWLVRPRSLRLSVSPLGALAAAGIAIVAALIGLRRDGGIDRTAELSKTGEFKVTGEHPAVAATASRTRDTVFINRFVFVAPDAKAVSLVGDFNDWDQSKTPLRKVANGLWTADVALPDGAYKYSFLVDGQTWKADPAAPRAVGDDFGRPSSLITVREGVRS